MNEWTIGLATVAVIFFVLACVAANRCLTMYQEIQKMERKMEDLRYSNKALKTQADTLLNRLYAAPDVEKMTALRMSLHMKQEENDALREKIKRQNQLLNQKWEEAKKCS